MTYTAVARRSGGWWTITMPELPEVFSAKAASRKANRAGTGGSRAPPTAERRKRPA